MKRIVIFLLLILLVLSISAQNDRPAQIATTSMQNSSAKFLLFPTQNYFIFLKLNTRTGDVYMVQYSTEADKRVEMKINSWQYPLVKVEEQMNGRFFLYPTTNIYNFILLDQVDGRVWQVQWNPDENKRLLTRIFGDNKMWSLSDSVKIKDLEYNDHVYWKNGELFNGWVFSNDGKSLVQQYIDGRAAWAGSMSALHDNGGIAFLFLKPEDIESDRIFFKDENGDTITLDEFKRKYPLIIPRVKKAITDFK